MKHFLDYLNAGSTVVESYKTTRVDNNLSVISITFLDDRTITIIKNVIVCYGAGSFHVLQYNTKALAIVNKFLSARYSLQN